MSDTHLPESEARDLRESYGVVDRFATDRLELRGEDRLRFLNGQVTCDVAALEPGKGTYGFFTTVKGRIEADTTVLAFEDRLLLILPSGLGAAIRERLERYIIVDQVEISVPEPAEQWTFLGPEAAARLEELFGAPPPAEAFAHCRAEAGGEAGFLVKEGRLGDAAWSLWLPPEAVDGLEVQQVGEEAFEAYRIEVGMSRFGQDFGPENLPQETGLDGARGYTAVSYTKGCYLGQEIVARLHYRGQVSRQLRRLEGSGPLPESLPRELTLDGRRVGTVTSAAETHGKEGWLGIGLIQRRAFEPETEVELDGGGTAVVRELPVG